MPKIIAEFNLLGPDNVYGPRMTKTKVLRLRTSVGGLDEHFCLDAGMLKNGFILRLHKANISLLIEALHKVKKELQ